MSRTSVTCFVTYPEVLTQILQFCLENSKVRERLGNLRVGGIILLAFKGLIIDVSTRMYS
jgi:hypothetical protein